MGWMTVAAVVIALVALAVAAIIGALIHRDQRAPAKEPGPSHEGVDWRRRVAPIRPPMRVGRLLRDGARVLPRLLSDPRVPRPIKGLLAIAVLPIPGPFDELAGVVALSWLARRMPGLLGEHWAALRGPETTPARLAER
jgi:hypothetical protein